MHCSMSVDSSTPTPTAKSCNYDTHTGRLDSFVLKLRFLVNSEDIFFGNFSSDGLNYTDLSRCVAAVTPSAALLPPAVSLEFIKLLLIVIHLLKKERKKEKSNKCDFVSK